jgi:hypothetical protein
MPLFESGGDVTTGNQDGLGLRQCLVLNAVEGPGNPSGLESSEERFILGAPLTQEFEAPRPVKEGNHPVPVQGWGEVGVMGREQGGMVRIVEQTLDPVPGFAIDISPIGARALSASVHPIHPHAAPQFDFAQSIVWIFCHNMDFVAPAGHEVRDFRCIAVGASIDVWVITRTEKNKAHRLLIVAAKL